MLVLRFLLVILMCPFLSARFAPSEPVVDYDIRVSLDTDRKRLFAQQTLRYVNPSPDVLGTLQFHLYLNAFKNSRSTYYRESGGTFSNQVDAFAFMHIQSLKVNGVASGFVYVQPDGTDPKDQTVIEVALPQPLFPGESVEVQLSFEAQLPAVFERTGYYRDFFMVAQWFPKLGVWQSAALGQAPVSRWNCHQFHRDSEFFANFGDYSVEITVPADFVVGATGHMVEKQEREEVWVYRFKAQNVHDFAFCASPDLLQIERTFEPAKWISEEDYQAATVLLDVPREALALPKTKMILLLQPQNRHLEERHFEALAQAIAYYGLHFGPYPYPVITMLDTPEDAPAAGGMEYPTFFTAGTYAAIPHGDWSLEDVIIHEYGHQYFYGMLASNEFEEAFMDEGFTNFTAGRCLDRVYGPGHFPQYYWGIPRSFAQVPVPLFDWLGLQPFTEKQRSRIDYMRDDPGESIAKQSWEYASGYHYGNNSYSKTQFFLYQLEAELGPQVFARTMRNYFQQWSFKHPRLQDFQRVAEATSGRDLGWFFERLFYRYVRLDYQLASIDVYPEADFVGFTDTDGIPRFHDGSTAEDKASPPPRPNQQIPPEEGPEKPSQESAEPHSEAAPEPQAEQTPPLPEPEPETPEIVQQKLPLDEPATKADEQIWVSEVMVRRKGTIAYPVTVEVTFEDGSAQQRTWDGSGTWQRFVFRGTKKVVRAQLDPQNKVLIDLNPVNNGLDAQPQPDHKVVAPSLTLFTRFQLVLDWLAGSL